MPLIDQTGQIDDAWVRVADDEALPDGAHVIVTPARYGGFDTVTHDAHVGVDIGQSLDDGMALVSRRKAGVPLISIDFPAMADGRGFSIAQALRQAGFQGTLRARGPLIADQFGYARACGFDEIEITADIARRQPGNQWSTAAKAFSQSYQPGRPGNALEQRRAQRVPEAVHAWAI